MITPFLRHFLRSVFSIALALSLCNISCMVWESNGVSIKVTQEQEGEEGNDIPAEYGEIIGHLSDISMRHYQVVHRPQTGYDKACTIGYFEILSPPPEALV